MSKGVTNYQRMGQLAWEKMPKVSSELFALTYGSMVTQVIKDYEKVDDINEQLDKMGYNIGIRLIDEFLAKSGVDMDTPCSSLRETADMICKVAFRMFLNVNADCSNWGADDNQFSVLFNDNPLTEFVELPPNLQDLRYCNIFAGIIRGALSMVQLDVETELVREVLRGDDSNEIKVVYKQSLKTEMASAYDET
jgi:hypothetical protein